MCTDYEVLNPAAVEQVRAGVDINHLTGEARAGSSALGRSDR